MIFMLNHINQIITPWKDFYSFEGIQEEKFLVFNIFQELQSWTKYLVQNKEIQ